MLVASNVPESSSTQVDEQVTVFTQLNRAYRGFTSSLIGMPQSVQDEIIAAGDNMEEVKRIWNEYTNKFIKH